MISSEPPPVPAPKDSESGPVSTRPLPELPGETTQWDEADIHLMRGPAATFSDPPAGQSADGPALSIGHIGRYALKHQLGEGGIGTVYAAHDPLLSRPIAVKTLHLEIDEAEREAFNALFLNEARAAAGLSHPHIVTVFDAGISDDRAYIAMELLKGRDLRQLRQDGWRATPAQAALIVRRVADALAYAHSRGVVHRDVKPANIFMTGRTQPKVLDFGIARITHQHDAHDSQAAGIAAGSPYYMAPEQVRHENVDRRADVFSLGVVLYELLTNVKPFRGNTLAEITAAVLKHDPPLAHTVDPSVPEALAQITAKALAKNPELRYRSARAFARELRHWLDENTITTDGDVQLGKRSTKPLWVAFGVLVAVVLGAVVWASVAPQRGKSAAAPLAAASARAALSSASAPVPSPSVAASAIEAVVAPAAVESPAASATEPTTAAIAAAPMPDKPVAAAASSVPKNVPVPKELRENAKDKRAREARERDARLAAATAAAVPTPTGVVRIAISPWGEVEVDGRAAGTSPPLTELSLPAGRHQVVVRNTDLPPFSTSINVTADQPVTIKHKF